MFCSNCGKEIDNNSKFCDACGAALDGAAAQVIETNPTQSPQEAVTPAAEQATAANGKKKRTKFKDLPPKKKAARLIIGGAFLFIAFLLFIGDALGTTTGSMVIPAHNDSGAVFNMSLDEFSEKFDEVSNLNNFLNGYWSNEVEPLTDYEENSGQKFTEYSAFLNNAVIMANVQNNKLSSVRVIFSSDDYSIGAGVAGNILRVCADITIEESAKAMEALFSGTAETNTAVYINGVLLHLQDESCVMMAASEEYVASIENSGGCDVIRM